MLIETGFTLNKLCELGVAPREQLFKNLRRFAKLRNRDLFSANETCSLIVTSEHKQTALIPHEKAPIPRRVLYCLFVRIISQAVQCSGQVGGGEGGASVLGKALRRCPQHKHIICILAILKRNNWSYWLSESEVFHSNRGSSYCNESQAIPTSTSKYVRNQILSTQRNTAEEHKRLNR